jgi:tetratricopeptide (TPR) repeat protein
MRRPAVIAACALGAALVLLSCSSAPKKSDTVITVKIQADQDAASGEGYYRQGRYDLALQFFTNALSQFTSVDDGAGIVRSYTSVGKCYIALGSLDQAESILLRAREKARGEGASLLFDASITLGELYLARGQPQEALPILQETAHGTPESRDPQRAALLNHDLGTAEKNLGNSVKALEYFNLSLSANLAGKLFAEAAADYYMIASVHSRDGKYDEALKNANLALAYDKQVENSPGIVKDLSALGIIAVKKGDHAAAFDYFQRSYLAATTLGFREDMRKALAGLVAAADALGRTDDAAAYRKALADLGTS